MNSIQNAIRAIMPKGPAGTGAALKAARAQNALDRDAGLSATMMVMCARTLM